MESISLDMNFSGFIDPTSDMELDLLSLLDRDRSAYNFDEQNMGAPNGANQDTENMLENFMSMECDTLKLDYMDLDEFLNLNNSACESGILVDDKKVSNSFCEDNSQIDNLSSVRSIECDHPYAMSLSTKDHHGSSSSLCEVTSEHFDSGISSSSGSPQSNRLCNDSPVSIEDSIQPARFTKQVVKTQLDLSDVDLHELAVNCMPDETVSPANRHDSPFICDLTSVDSDASQYDAVTGQFGDCDRLSSCGSNDASSDDIPTSQHLFQRSITSDKLLRSLPNFRPLVLTDEESRLLMEEGVSIPTDLPLTKYEEKVLKKVRRKIRNKRSAMASRQKKKDYVDGLEQRVQQCTGLNQSLERRVKELETQNYSLMAQLRKLREVVKTSNHKTTQATSCLMVLMLSLGLFIAPSYGPLSVQKATDQQQQRNVDVHRSRKVLEYKPGSDSPRLIKQPFFPVGGMVVDADVVVEAQPSYKSWSVKEEADHKELVVAMAQTKPEDYELSRTRRSLLENSTLDEKQLAPADAFPPPDVDVGGFDRQAAVPSKTEALATSAPFPVATSGGGDIAMKRVMVATTDAPVAKLRRSEM